MSDVLVAPQQTTNAARASVDRNERRRGGVARRGTHSAKQGRQSGDRLDRMKMADGQRDAFRIFEGQHDEHDVERLQVKIALQMIERADRFGFDTEMARDRSPDDVVVVSRHELFLFPQGVVDFRLGIVT